MRSYTCNMSVHVSSTTHIKHYTQMDASQGVQAGCAASHSVSLLRYIGQILRADPFPSLVRRFTRACITDSVIEKTCGAVTAEHPLFQTHLSAVEWKYFNRSPSKLSWLFASATAGAKRCPGGWICYCLSMYERTIRRGAASERICSAQHGWQRGLDK